jgi:DNA-directed RNA polymerase specialized sigma24 family protein
MGIISYLRRIRTRIGSSAEYATREDFCRVFNENLDDLYQLAYVLTGDDEKARQCFVAGLEDSIKSNHVFKEWARCWARRAIIENAIHALQPKPGGPDSSWSTRAISEKHALRVIRDSHLEIDSLLALEDFERFVFVLTVLERYSDHDAALLIACSIAEIRAGRVCAFEQIAILATDSSDDLSEDCGPHKLPVITNNPP